MIDNLKNDPKCRGFFPEERDTIIIIDDEDAFLNLGRTYLSDTYDVQTVKTWSEFIYTINILDRTPACFLIDLNLGKTHGFEIMERIKGYKDLANVPVIIITGEFDSALQESGFEKGAFDFVLKPYYPKVLKKRVEKAVKMFHLQENLQSEVEKQTAEAERQRKIAESTLTHVVDALICTIEAKDYYTKGHSVRVSNYSEILANEIGITGKENKEIARAGALHDIGKISVPVKLLTKDGKLSDNEFERIKAHTVAGDVILTSIAELGVASDVARHHHERWDGSGYPDGLKGEEISLASRIVAIADAFDVMSQGRIYQKPLPLQTAIDELRRCSGTQFDPYLTEIFIKLIEEGMIDPNHSGPEIS